MALEVDQPSDAAGAICCELMVAVWKTKERSAVLKIAGETIAGPINEPVEVVRPSESPECGSVMLELGLLESGFVLSKSGIGFTGGIPDEFGVPVELGPVAFGVLDGLFWNVLGGLDWNVSVAPLVFGAAGCGVPNCE